jgi:exopolysaccharide biosynthesis polyprenyl glycosylphosphotransferase
VTANIPELLSTRIMVQPVAGVMALSLMPIRLSGGQSVLKRTFDLVVGGLAAVVLLPLFLLIALTIAATSRGPVIYRQERVGRRGQRFPMYKFRTMVMGADAMVDQLRPQNQAGGPLFKIRDDPRVTGIGRWIRRWSLDELPQLWNVLRGDMSLVGPRPPLPEEVKAYRDWHLDRLEVRPGLTGLWQVSGRSDLSFDDYVRLDLFYIENWSLAYDLFIIAKTVPVLLTSRGAY